MEEDQDKLCPCPDKTRGFSSTRTYTHKVYGRKYTYTCTQTSTESQLMADWLAWECARLGAIRKSELQFPAVGSGQFSEDVLW